MLPPEGCRELATVLESVESHLVRYEDGSARDANNEMQTVRLLIERVKVRLAEAAEDG